MSNARNEIREALRTLDIMYLQDPDGLVALNKVCYSYGLEEYNRAGPWIIITHYACEPDPNVRMARAADLLYLTHVYTMGDLHAPWDEVRREALLQTDRYLNTFLPEPKEETQNEL